MKKYSKLLKKNTQTLYTYTTPKKNGNYFDTTRTIGGDTTTATTTVTNPTTYIAGL